MDPAARPRSSIGGVPYLPRPKLAGVFFEWIAGPQTGPVRPPLPRLTLLGPDTMLGPTTTLGPVKDTL